MIVLVLFFHIEVVFDGVHQVVFLYLNNLLINFAGYRLKSILKYMIVILIFNFHQIPLHCAIFGC